MTRFKAHLQAQYTHYRNLYTTPGWRDYARQRIMELAEQHPDDYGDFPARMRAEFPQKVKNGLLQN